MNRRSGRHFSEQDKEDLLQALGACRKALQTADTRLKPFGEEYKACLKVQESIDEPGGRSDRRSGLLSGETATVVAAGLILVVAFVIQVVHTLTEGRRGRRWGECRVISRPGKENRRPPAGSPIGLDVTARLCRNAPF